MPKTNYSAPTVEITFNKFACRNIVLLFLTVMSIGSLAMGNGLRPDLENIGGTFTVKATSLINGWANGSMPLPDLSSSARDIVDSWVLNAESKAQTDSLHQLSSDSNSPIEQFSKYADSARREINSAIQRAAISGDIEWIFNDITSEFAQHGCDLGKSEICLKLRKEMFGLYVVLRRTPELTLQGSRHIVTHQMTGSVLNQLFNGDLGQINNCLVQILRFAEDSNPIYLQQFEHWINKLYPVYGTTSNSLNLDTKLEKYKLINHWRINCSIVNGSFASNADRNSYYTQAAADRLTILYPALSNLLCGSDQTSRCESSSAAELYTGLESLLKYFKAQGRIHDAQKVQILEGTLRASRSELIPNFYERIAYKYAWGSLTDFGTSIYKVLLIWLFGFILCFAWAGCYWSGISETTYFDIRMTSRLPFIEVIAKAPQNKRIDSERTVGGKALETAILFMTLRDDPLISNMVFVNFFRLTSFILVSLAVGYFVFYLSRTF